MKINIKVNKTFKINGKEYHSLDEMPEDIRELFKKEQQHRSGPETKEGAAVIRTKLFFNGTEYASVDAMPADIRGLYDMAMKAAASGGGVDGKAIGDAVKGMSSNQASGPMRHREGPVIETSFSAKSLLAGVLVLALIVLLYFLVKR